MKKEKHYTFYKKNSRLDRAREYLNSLLTKHYSLYPIHYTLFTIHYPLTIRVPQAGLPSWPASVMMHSAPPLSTK